MAIDPSIALQGRGLDVASALRSGAETGEMIRTSGVREQLLNQQAQAQAMNLAQTRGQYMSQLATGLMNKPLDQRAAIVAQQMPFMQQMGINPADILSQDLTDQGLSAVVTQTQPFVQQQATTAPAGVREFESLTEGLTDEQVQQAKLVRLGLAPRAIQSAPKLVEVAGVKYMQVGDQLFNPQNAEPVNLDELGAEPQEQPVVLTPEAQIEQEAGAKAAIAGATTEAVEEVKREFEQEDPEVIARRQQAKEKQNKSIDSSYKVVNNIDTILSSDRLDDIAGAKGVLPTFRPKTKDLINTVSQLSSLLTVENLGVMSGVLSESDMKVIKGIANDIGIKFDKDGTVEGFSGSVEGTVKKLRKLKAEIAAGLRRNGYGLEGDIATNPDTGERLVFTNFEWTPM